MCFHNVYIGFNPRHTHQTQTFLRHYAQMGRIISGNQKIAYCFPFKHTHQGFYYLSLCFYFGMKAGIVPTLKCTFFLIPQTQLTYMSCLYRFKPLQKVDGMSDSLCGSSQHCNSTPEQSVAAQSQHHQQYIGEDSSWLAATTVVCLQMFET